MQERLAALAALADEEAGVLAQEDLETERNAALKEELAAEEAQEGIASVSPPTPTVDPRQTLIDNISGLASVEAYKPNEAVTAAMEKQLQRDPAKEAEAAAARVAEFSKLEEGLGALTDRRQRAKDLYEERNDPRRIKQNRFFALLGGLGDGGTRGANKAARAYEQKQEAIRDKHEANLNAIDDASILLQRTVGAKQATEYNLTAKAADTAITSAMSTMVNMDAIGRNDELKRIELAMNSEKLKLESLDRMDKSAKDAAAIVLTREELSQNNVVGQYSAASTTIDSALEVISEEKTRINDSYRSQLRKAQGDEVETARLEQEMEELLLQRTATAHSLLKDAQDVQARATAFMNAQVSRLTSSSFGGAADAAILANQ